ncbi:MAG TPA: efflux RND transporter periplasmic adaptor subunit [Gemmatimonadaceae bacterium]|nr:efflux RND transporter periplasmic adaptor subunit [Gemmatimonadaceae bacterium]
MLRLGGNRGRSGIRLGLAVLLVAACRGRDPDTIEGTGTLEVVEVDVAPMTPARVLRVWRQEGDTVRVGDTLVSLTQSTARADVEGRRARVVAAEAQLRDLQAGARPAEIGRAEAELRAAESEAARSAQDLQRVTGLAQTGTVSVQQLDAAKNSAALAAARRDAARDAVRLLQEGTRPERIAAARAEVANARAALNAAEQTAADLVLVAPVSGTVMVRSAEPGEVVGAGMTAMTIGELARPYVRIYVNQRALPRVRLGASAQGVLDGLPDRPFSGRVIAINSKAEFTPRVALTEEERADLVFGVKVAFDDSAGALKPGLPITVRIGAAPRP